MSEQHSKAAVLALLISLTLLSSTILALRSAAAQEIPRLRVTVGGANSASLVAGQSFEFDVRLKGPLDNFLAVDVTFGIFPSGGAIIDAATNDTNGDRVFDKIVNGTVWQGRQHFAPVLPGFSSNCGVLNIVGSGRCAASILAQTINVTSGAEIVLFRFSARAGPFSSANITITDSLIPVPGPDGIVAPADHARESLALTIAGAAESKFSKGNNPKPAFKQLDITREGNNQTLIASVDLLETSKSAFIQVAFTVVSAAGAVSRLTTPRVLLTPSNKTATLTVTLTVEPIPITYKVRAALFSVEAIRDPATGDLVFVNFLPFPSDLETFNFRAKL